MKRCPLLATFLVGIVVLLPRSLALILPPADRIRMGELEDLYEECEHDSQDAGFVWKDHVREEYQLANEVFTHLATSERGPCRIWLPSCLNHQGEIERMASALNENSHQLGGLRTTCQHWPDVPASVLDITWKETPTRPFYQRDSQSTIDDAIRRTEDYVNNIVSVSKKGLCPFTMSMERSATGLDHLGVKEGPVVIRHAGQIETSETTTPAAVLGALFWQGVTELIERPETDVSTLLLVAPQSYDDDFDEFYKTCDNLLEKSVAMTSNKVGRVWFHPDYELERVDRPTGGHTLPLNVVSGLMDEYLGEHPSIRRPSHSDMARGHDQTRQTPHATINLLRASQLSKAKDYNNRAKIFARNILTMLGTGQRTSKVAAEDARHGLDTSAA